MKIWVIGSSNTEMIFRSSVIPAGGESVMGKSFVASPGGRGFNQSIAAARAGGKVVFISRMGNDLYGENMIRELSENHIDVSSLIKDENLPSGISSLVVDDEGKSAITIIPGANMNLSTRDIQHYLDVQPGDYVLLQLDIPIETVKYASSHAGMKGAKIILNPSPALPVSDELLKSIDILTPDTAQAVALTGITITDERTAELAGRILLERGLKRVIVTLGADGAMVIDNGGAEHVPGFEIKPLDTSVSSDVFNGALAVALSEGKNFYESVLFANAACAVSSSLPGSVSSIPQRPDILFALKQEKRKH
ncbi:MAG TPA: ribokinase [Bacteroidales bacterium]|nr:ribokinase [Bacteroidales bacterium]